MLVNNLRQLKAISKGLSLVSQQRVTFASQEPQHKDSPPPQGGNNRLFKHIPSSSLLKRIIIYKLCQTNLFIDKGEMIIRNCYKALGKRFTNVMINNTAGEIFTAGESIAQLSSESERLIKGNIESYGNYMLEGIETEDAATYDANTKYTISVIKEYCIPRPYTGIALKLTAYMPMGYWKTLNKKQEDIFAFYDKLSSKNGGKYFTKADLEEELAVRKISYSQQNIDEFFRLVRKDLENEADSDKITKLQVFSNLHAFPIDLKNVSNLQTKLWPLSSKEIMQGEKLLERLHMMIKEAADNKIRLLIDAEQTFIQLTIDSFTRQFASIYNKDYPLLLNGFQGYLKRSEAFLSLEIERCKKLGICFGAKLIRGAYMNEERRVAEEKKYESPVWETIEATHTSMHRNVEYALRNMPKNSHVLIGSHNENTVNLGTKLMQELGLTNDQVGFAQLKGMSDHLTFQLAAEGYKVAKYLPFGPTEELMPYLIRRAQESKQVMRETKYQDEFLKKELKNRLTFK